MMSERPFAQKSTVHSRRAAERRAAAARQAYEQAVMAQRAPHTPQDTIPPKAPRQPRPKLSDELNRARPKPKRNPQRRLIAYSVLSSAAALATVLYGAPLFDRPASPAILVGGGLLTFLLAERVFFWFKKASRSARIVAMLIPALLALFFVMGLKSQVVIDGTAFPAWSPEAKAYSLSSSMYDDLLTIRNNDAYLTLPLEQARSRSSDIKAAALKSASIAERWNPSAADESTPGDFLQVMSDLNSSAYAQAQALDLLGQNVLQYDAARESDIASLRQASVQTFINATDDLRSATSPFGFDPTAPKGPVE